MRNTFFAFVTILCYATSVQGQTIPCTAGVQSGYLCITLTKSSTDWVTASETCKDAGGDLLAVTSASLQDTLNTIMANEATNEVWVGGQEVAGPWRFIQDDIDISPQGCFRDPKTNADRNNGINIENLIPERCISACRDASYKYAAVQGGTYCYCYNSYEGKTVTSGCTDQCPGDQTKYCGSWDKSFIYKINGAYGSWSYNQPNYWDNYQHCGVIDWPANNFKFADEKCNENFDYICEINSQSCSYTSMDGHCLYLSNGDQISWFAARQRCVSMAGDLVQIDSASKHDTVRKLLTNGGQTQQKYWMGLVSKTWKWTTGASMRGYSAWGSRQPSSPYSECLRVVKSGSAYEWQDGYCTDRKAYVCQFDYTPTTVKTTTVSTTPKPVPQTTKQGDVISKNSVTTSAAVISSTASPSMSVGTSSSQSGVAATANPNAFTSASNNAEISTNSSWSAEFIENTTKGKATPTPKATKQPTLSPTTQDITTATDNVTAITTAVETEHVSTTMTTMRTTSTRTGGSTKNSSNNNNNSTAGGQGVPPTEPGAGASTAGSGLSTFQIVLIVILVLLIITIIIATIVFVYYKKSTSNAVAPRESKPRESV